MRITLLVALLFAESNTPEPKPVWAGSGVTLLGGPSLDGRYLSYVDPASGGLAVRELSGGASRVLASKPETPLMRAKRTGRERVSSLNENAPDPLRSKEFAYFSAIAPDSSQIAYAWFNGDRFYELRVIPFEGGEPRTLYRNEEAGFVQPCP